MNALERDPSPINPSISISINNNFIPFIAMHARVKLDSFDESMRNPTMRLFLLFIMAVTLAIAADPSSDSTQCQKALPPSGCRCYAANIEGVVEDFMRCDGFVDTDSVISTFQNAFRYHVSAFTVAYSSLQYFPVDLLEHVRFLSLSENALVQVFNRAPEKSALEIFYLYNITLLRRWSWEQLAGQTELRKLYIYDMPLGEIDVSFRAHANRGLQQIVLKRNEIRNIDDLAFKEFTALTDLQVTENAIATLKRSMFPFPWKVKYLNFEKNRISSLSEDMFSNMPDLSEIQLQDNLISQVLQTAFGGIWSTNIKIYLNGNPLKCDCKIEWITRAKPKDLTGKCLSPKEKYNKNISELTPKDFRC